MELYLIRHGETKWNEEGRLQGQMDIPLNENGRKLARLTGEGLKDLPFDHIYVSPLCRAKETGELVFAGRGIPQTEDDRLKEIDFGPWEGHFVSTLPESYKNFCHAPDKYAAPEGAESLPHLISREMDFIRDVLVPASDRYVRVAVVAHGACGQALKLCLGHKKLSDFWKPQFPYNCSVSIFEINGDDWKQTADNKIYYPESLIIRPLSSR